MAEVTIQEAKRIPALDPARRGKFDRMVFYSTAPGQTFMLIVPEEGLTDQALLAAIRADQVERTRLVGKTFTL